MNINLWNGNDQLIAGSLKLLIVQIMVAEVCSNWKDFSGKNYSKYYAEYADVK